MTRATKSTTNKFTVSAKKAPAKKPAAKKAPALPAAQSLMDDFIGMEIAFRPNAEEIYDFQCTDCLDSHFSATGHTITTSCGNRFCLDCVDIDHPNNAYDIFSKTLIAMDTCDGKDLEVIAQLRQMKETIEKTMMLRKQRDDVDRALNVLKEEKFYMDMHLGRLKLLDIE